MRIILRVFVASLCFFLFSCTGLTSDQGASGPCADLPNTRSAQSDAAFCVVVASLSGTLEGIQCIGGESQYFIHTADVQPAKIEKGLAENVPWSVDWEGARKAGLTVVYLFGGNTMDTAKAFLYPQIQPIPESAVKDASGQSLQHIADAQLALILGEGYASRQQKYVKAEADFIDRDGRIFAVRTIDEGVFSCGRVRIGFFARKGNLLTYTLCGNDSALEAKLIPVFEDMMETTIIAR